MSTQVENDKICPLQMLDIKLDYTNLSECPFHNVKHENPEYIDEDFNGAFKSLSIMLFPGNLLHDIGGGDRIHQLTTRFYTHAFQDFTLSKFMFATDGPASHGQRLGDWMIEKMGGEGTPWSDSGRHGMRQTSHRQAWYSEKREPERRGQRFKCDDCRVWMRLFFWSAREVGLDKHKKFFYWLVKAIARMISIYAFDARKYTSIDADWSKHDRNIVSYKENNQTMVDVLGMGR